MNTVEGVCRACGAAILWLRSDRTGRVAPITATASDHGNVRIDARTGSYHVLGKEEDWSGERHVNHFVDCPGAAQFREVSTLR